MHSNDSVSDPMLNRIYRGERELHNRGISEDWFVGFLVHLQRSDSRALKASLRDILAQHTQWITNPFDLDELGLDDDLAVKNKEMEENGFTYFQLPRTQADDLLAAFHGTEVCSIDRAESHIFGPQPMVSTYTALSSEFTERQACVLTMPAIVRLATNRHILKLVRRYLGALPRLSSMGISINQPEQKGALPSGNWHIDKGPISWLKMFVYLCDVDIETGPHAYVAGSHKDELVEQSVAAVFADQQDLRVRLLTSQRWGDKEILAIFPGREIYHTGAAGVAILEDTGGFHKATPVISGQRIMLTLEWSLDPSPLGGQRTRIRFEDVPTEIRPAPGKAEQRFRYIFSEYLKN
jgi:hypothetical protein